MFIGRVINLGIVLLLLSIFSCKTKKAILSGPQISQQEAIDKLYNHNRNFEWFSAKGKMQFKSNVESGKGSINVRIRKDSVIWMNIKKLGMEVARVLIEPDSIHIIYRLDRSFERGKLSDYTRSYGLDLSFDKMQDFFVGNVILGDSTKIESNIEEDFWHLSGVQGKLQLDYWVNAFTGNVQEYHLIDNTGREVVMIFEDHKPYQDGNDFAYSREYFAPIDSLNEAFAKVKISAVEFDVKKKISFQIPEHYEEY